MIKVILTIQKRSDMSEAAFRRYYIEQHGPIVTGLTGLRRYVQNPWHVEFGADEPIPSLVSPRLLGAISELWFDDISAFKVAMQSDAWRLSGEDLPNFTNAEATTVNVVEERNVAFTKSDDEQIVRSFYRAVETGNEQTLRAILAANWEELPTVYPGQVRGAEGYLPVVRGFNAAFPDGRFEVHELMQTENRFVVRTTFTGTHSAPFFGREATGATIAFNTIDIHEVIGRHITRSWHIEDIAGAVAQMDGKK
jgi:uncharacterized protein (TIGR02118 family)